MSSISELVWLYVKRRPFLREVIRQKVVNFSALGRKMSIEMFGTSKKTGAVKAALQRISSRLEKAEEDLERDIFSVLKGSSIAVRSKVAVVVSASELDVKAISYAKSQDSITYIVHAKDLAGLRKTRAIRRIEETANLITISSGEEIEVIPGVISTVLGALSAEGINVLEFISCYTDTLLVLKESDTARAYALLSSLTK